MRYFLDFEHDSGVDIAPKNKLISMALVSEQGDELYLVFTDQDQVSNPWVIEHVVPFIQTGLHNEIYTGLDRVAVLLEQFFSMDPDGHPHVIADYPMDISLLTTLLIHEPGRMIDIPGITFEVNRVDAYPTDYQDCTQHNAYWDAVALRYKLTGVKTRRHE